MIRNTIKHSLTTVFFIAALFLSSATVSAQSLPADRPGVGYTSALTEKSDLILESGTTVQSGNLTIGEIFLKAGVHEQFELQFHTGSLLWDTNAGSTSRSTPAFLAKYDPQLDLPENLGMSLLARTFLPILDPNANNWLTQVLVLADYQFTDVFSLSVNAGYGDFVDNIGDGIFTFTTNPGIAINPQLTAYGGYGWYGNSGTNYSIFEAGLIYLQHSRLQLDIGFQYDSNDTAYLTAGIITGF